MTATVLFVVSATTRGGAVAGALNLNPRFNTKPRVQSQARSALGLWRPERHRLFSRQIPSVTNQRLASEASYGTAIATPLTVSAWRRIRGTGDRGILDQGSRTRIRSAPLRNTGRTWANARAMLREEIRAMETRETLYRILFNYRRYKHNSTRSPALSQHYRTSRRRHETTQHTTREKSTRMSSQNSGRRSGHQ